MKYIRLVKFDFKYGILKRWYTYLLYSLLTLFACLDFSFRLKTFDISSFSLGDCLFYFYAGINEYIPKPDEPIRIPYLWLLLNLLVCYFNVHYMSDDLSGLGQYVICRCGKRRNWWLSKCLWNFSSVLVYFCLSILIIFLFSMFCNAEFSFEISETMNLICPAGDGQYSISQWDIGSIQLFFMPVLVCAAISMLQMFISLFVRPLVSYVVTIVIYFSSMYKLSGLLLGNYAMALRSDEIVINGVPASGGIIFSVCLILASVLCGLLYFQHYNILSRE
ncbi:MAG: hypothetical protein PUD24_06180 [Oscillospiraceae bacterium]|nr:hypothetical protein [Oscillospiraceae bacterium]